VPTLWKTAITCLDVAYDMNEVLVEDDADLDSDKSNTSDEGGSDIYWEEGE